MKTKPFKIEDCDKNKKIIIYGASVYGELAYRGLKAAGISPTFFVINQIKETYIWG